MKETQQHYDRYFQDNLNCWNGRVPAHIKSDFYNVQSFLEGKSSLTQIEREYLGIVSGQRILHLQCHFGLDTLSMSRMGAEMVGIDFSAEAINEAKKLNEISKQNAVFYESNVYDVPKLKLGLFDMVFTSYGTIGWLPDLDKWASVISDSLKEKGIFYICDFHPGLYMFDFNSTQIAYSYFNIGMPYTEEETGSYADKESSISVKTHFWSHALSEIISSLLHNGLKITLFKEFDYSPYPCFPNTRKIEENKYIFGNEEWHIPHLYLIKAIKE